MKTITLILSIILSTVTLAGPGHGHSHGKKLPAVSKDKVEKISRFHMMRLIKAGKLNSSWSKSKFYKSEKKLFSGKLEWVVSFTNEKGVKGKKLYFFLKESGSFIAANFTGK